MDKDSARAAFGWFASKVDDSFNMLCVSAKVDNMLCALSTGTREYLHVPTRLNHGRRLGSGCTRQAVGGVKRLVMKNQLWPLAMSMLGIPQMCWTHHLPCVA